MSLKVKIIIGVVCVLLVVPFIFDMLTVEKLSWASIQRYGGIRTDPPIETQDGYYLPVVCDVSGRDSTTIRSTGFNPNNLFKRAMIEIKDHDVLISISISGSLFSDQTSKCKAIKLGNLQHGHYKVFYEGGELIGEFYI